MTIKTSSLKTFQKLAANFKGNGIMPITDYLLFKGGKVTKTVMSSFIQMDCDGIDQEMLVDEKHLYNILNSTASDFINVVKKGNKVVLSDSRDTITFQTKEVKEFPSIPVSSDEKTELSPEFVLYLNMASHFSAQKEQIPSFKSFVMVGNKSICASDGFIAYKGDVGEGIKAVIEKNTASFVSKMNIDSYGQCNNYYFFYAKGITMGFSTQEIGYVDMGQFFPKDKVEIDFVVGSSDLVSFNHLASKSAPNKKCVLSVGKITMQDADLDVFLQRDLEGLKPSEDFKYYPDQLNRVLSAIQSEDIDVIKAERMYYLRSGNEKFTALIMKIPE